MSLLDRLGEQVSRRPDAAAIRSADATLTYRELWKATDRFRQWLVGEGVRPGALVGLEVGRRIPTVIAVIGTLRAGAAYLPLLHSWPVERRRSLTKAAGVDIVVTDGGDVVSRGEGNRVEDRVVDDDLAYVLYTSGTTGAPKGVAIGDANVCAMLDAALTRLKVDADDVWSMAHVVTFDFSVWEIWGPLTTGGRIEILDDTEVTQPSQLRSRLARSGVTIFSQVPSSFGAFSKHHLEALAADDYGALRFIVFGGERARLADARDIITQSRGRVVPVNMYGITEATVHATFCELTPEVLRVWSGSAETPIGWPLNSHRVRIADPVAAADGSEVGELLLAGPAVSRGYWRDDDLNDSRFEIDQADADTVATVWFRTGDIVRRFLDGLLAYVERRDSQVKVMGYRIDLQEVERHVMSVAGTVGCAAYVVRNRGRDKLALAYVSDLHTPPAQITDHLRSVLPSYMVPSVIDPLPALPVTESGKIDRAAMARAGSTQGPQPCA